MALRFTNNIYLKIFENNNAHKHSVNVLGAQFSTSTAKYSDVSDSDNSRINKAMESYLKNAEEREAFLKEQNKIFELGKKHLANMMGVNEKEMTQSNIDKAIKYLFPSGLTVPGARPIMKHPNQIFSKTKSAEFDITGRPFNFLFYTVTPNYTKLLHDAATKLEELNAYEDKMISVGLLSPDKTLSLEGSQWISKENIEKKLLEVISDTDYNKLIEVFDCLAAHPYSYIFEDFIKSQRITLVAESERTVPVPKTMPDGSLSLTVRNCKRKSSTATVTVLYPGEGNIFINGEGLDYFGNIQAREQVRNCFQINFKPEFFFNANIRCTKVDIIPHAKYLIPKPING